MTKKHDFKCITCGKPATVNIQNVWKKYIIDEEGNFEDSDEWEGDTNDFYCDECDPGDKNNTCDICGKHEDDDGRCGCTNKNDY